ncbi:hypothetical protein [Streptomyces viridochromogenes]|uniref:hypothetical protein n=1 Tax=Streptomyces viridochromogenes TaxID=1938 RepID=UPI00069F9BEE|nr:hypothetical protein [Streptomyces viridochromogenes]KOG21782.1 hypothetical protein ADK36_12455 [Streptomyces viridochromogenes]
MDKHTAIQAAVNAAAVATQAINDYGRDSDEARGALDAARTAVTTARQHGATEDDLRTARPA